MAAAAASVPGNIKYGFDAAVDVSGGGVSKGRKKSARVELLENGSLRITFSVGVQREKLFHVKNITQLPHQVNEGSGNYFLTMKDGTSIFISCNVKNQLKEFHCFLTKCKSDNPTSLCAPAPHEFHHIGTPTGAKRQLTESSGNRNHFDEDTPSNKILKQRNDSSQVPACLQPNSSADVAHGRRECSPKKFAGPGRRGDRKERSGLFTLSDNDEPSDMEILHESTPSTSAITGFRDKENVPKNGIPTGSFYGPGTGAFSTQRQMTDFISSSSNKSLDAVTDEATENKRAKVDASHQIKGINELLTAEPDLLRTLFRFVPIEYSRVQAFEEGAPESREVKDIVVVSRFKLRNVCRHWNDIAEKQLNFSCCFSHGEKGEIQFKTRSGTLIADCRSMDEFDALPVRTDLSFETLPKCVSSLHIDLGYYCEFRPKKFKPNPSVASVLQRITQTIQQPCRLSLELLGYGTREFASFVKQGDVPLQSLFPNVTLEKLQLGTAAESLPNAIISAQLVLKHCLEFSFDSLVELDVELPLLIAALTGEGNGNRGNNGAFVLHADWSCSSLRNLELYDEPLREDGKEYDYNDADKRAAAHSALAKLSRRFPKITSLSFHSSRPQIDFAALNQFADLHAFSLQSWSSTVQLRIDSNLTPLPNIKTFSIDSTATFPVYLSTVVPNVKTLTILPVYAGAFADLASELSKCRSSFEHLKTLVIKSAGYTSGNGLPSFTELVRLLRSLDRLSNLGRLEIVCCYQYRSTWGRQGDLSLVQVLPQSLKSASFTYSLLPSGVVRRDGSWTLNCRREVPSTAELIYKAVLSASSSRLNDITYIHMYAKMVGFKDWLRALLYRIHQHPSLEQFYCICVAPSFEAIYALAEKWNGSSTFAIADLGLASVVHIQCKPVYTRMLGTHIPRWDDRFKFRFILASRPELTGAKGALAKRKVVTVEFHNTTR